MQSHALQQRIALRKKELNIKRKRIKVEQDSQRRRMDFEHEQELQRLAFEESEIVRKEQGMAETGEEDSDVEMLEHSPPIVKQQEEEQCEEQEGPQEDDHLLQREFVWVKPNRKATKKMPLSSHRNNQVQDGIIKDEQMDEAPPLTGTNDTPKTPKADQPVKMTRQEKGELEVLFCARILRMRGFHYTLQNAFSDGSQKIYEAMKRRTDMRFKSARENPFKDGAAFFGTLSRQTDSWFHRHRWGGSAVKLERFIAERVAEMKACMKACKMAGDRDDRIKLVKGWDIACA